MVMKPEPIVAALDALRGGAPDPWVVLLTPQGRLFNQEMARSLSRRPRVAVICGRYEGIDERVGRYFADDQVSIGDYVLTGGEFAAMVLVDAVARLLPGVVGKVASVEEDSFAEPLLEHPHYTRPQSFQGHEVPEVLLSGNHEAIRRWRRAQTLLRTRLRRPDLLARVRLSAEDEKLLGQAMEETLRNGGEVPFVPPPGEEPPSSGPGTLPGGEPQG
jgi:tRNA (guanine37-N1)-methyltransferase